MALDVKPSLQLDLPPPEVPYLKQPENYLDLDQLMGQALETWINYPGMRVGDRLFPNWRGCGLQGQLVDFFEDLVVVEEDNPKGVAVIILNQPLQELDQGWVFYSYQLYDPNVQGNRGEESLRIFFNVGKRPALSGGLGAPQCKESHDLKLDPELLELGGEVLFVTPPYHAMRMGDTITLTLDLFFGENDPFQPLSQSKTLTNSDVGLPVQWRVTASDLLQIEGGYVLMSYSVTYAGTSITSQSSIQTLDIVEHDDDLLPALTIKDFSGGSLDPGAYPDGITLIVGPYPGMEVNDDVMLYVSGDTRVAQSLRADLSSVESGIVQFRLASSWLIANNGRQVEFMYEYARLGEAKRSLSRDVILRRPLDLPAPVIKDAIIDEPGDTMVKGHIFARQLTQGVTISIPKEAFIGAGDQVQMYWDGHGSPGRFIADPSPNDSRMFHIPPEAVPANMGKRLDVYYKVTPVLEPAGTSRVFNLEVRKLDGGWPFIQFVNPPVLDARLSLAKVPPGGAGLELPGWVYMAPGQRVRIKAVGLLQSSGTALTLGLRIGVAEPVTEAEYQARRVPVSIPREFLERLQRNSETNSVTVDVSFDDGLSYTQFPPITFTLVD